MAVLTNRTNLAGGFVTRNVMPVPAVRFAKYLIGLVRVRAIRTRVTTCPVIDNEMSFGTVGKTRRHIVFVAVLTNGTGLAGGFVTRNVVPVPAVHFAKYLIGLVRVRAIRTERTSSLVA